jgi:hypothetical protein
MCLATVAGEMNRIRGDVGVAVALGRESENLYLPAAQVRNPMAPAFGVEVDLVQMWSQQLENQPIPFAEVTIGAPEPHTSGSAWRGRQWDRD